MNNIISITMSKYLTVSLVFFIWICVRVCIHCTSQAHGLSVMNLHYCFISSPSRCPVHWLTYFFSGGFQSCSDARTREENLFVHCLLGWVKIIEKNTKQFQFCVNFLGFWWYSATKIIWIHSYNLPDFTVLVVAATNRQFSYKWTP